MRSSSTPQRRCARSRHSRLQQTEPPSRQRPVQHNRSTQLLPPQQQQRNSVGSSPRKRQRQRRPAVNGDRRFVAAATGHQQHCGTNGILAAVQTPSTTATATTTATSPNPSSHLYLNGAAATATGVQACGHDGSGQQLLRRHGGRRSHARLERPESAHRHTVIRGIGRTVVGGVSVGRGRRNVRRSAGVWFRRFALATGK